MFVAIDSGNTNLKIGIFDENENLINKIIIPNNDKNFFSSVEDFLKNIKCSICIVSSVVSEINPIIESIFFKLFNVTPVFINNKNTKCLSFNYEKPEMIGSDRIANILGALSIFKSPLLVCDFGTATTFSLALKENEFSGGLIAPGIKISFNSLNKSTSKLPEVDLDANISLIGTSTSECIKSGVFFMQLGFIEKVINSLKREYPKLKAICTGGYGKFFANSFDKYEENLVLKGCVKFYKKYNSSEVEKPG